MILPIGISNRKRMKGFTFIELILVVVLMGVIISMVLPAIQGKEEAIKLDQTAKELANTLEYARRMAVLQHCPYQVQINEQSHRFELAAYRFKEGEWNFLPIENRFASSSQWPASWQIRGATLFQFDSRGRTPAAEVILISPKRGRRTVSVPKGFSRVQVEES